MNFSAGAAPAPAAPAAPANSAADQPFDMNFASAGSATPAAAPSASSGAAPAGNSYYAELASGYAERAKAEDAARAEALPKPPAAKPAAPPPKPYQDPGMWANYSTPVRQAFGKLSGDVQRIANAKSPDQLPSTGEVLGDAAGYLFSPIAGAYNAVVTQPGADALDAAEAAGGRAGLPAAPQITGDVFHGYKVGPAMTPEQAHAANANAINTALQALPARGVKIGASGPGLSALADANDARVLSAANQNAQQYVGKVTQVVHDLPPEVALDPSGELTAEGREHATQAGVHPEDLKAGYQAVAQEQQAQRATAATNARAAAQQAAAEARDASQQAATAAQAGDPEAAAAAQQAATEKQAAAWQAREAATRALAEARGATAPAPEPVPQVAPELQAQAAAAPAADAAAAAGAAPAADETAWTIPEEGAPTTAAGRQAEAASEGVNLSEGQGTQDAVTQAKENDLRSAGDAKTQGFFNDQQVRLKNMLDRFRATFGDPTMTAADRGQIVQDALRGMLAQGQAGVAALYKTARDIFAGLGEQHQGLLDLDTSTLLSEMRKVIVDEGANSEVRNAVRQQAAKYGLIGENPRTVEGIGSVDLRDSNGKVSGKQDFVGPQEPLSVNNAEDLRQKLNGLFAKDTTGALAPVKRALDSAVADAIARADQATQGAASPAREAVDAIQQGRAAHAELKQTFSAKDIVEKLTKWVKGTEIREGGKVVGGTPQVLPEDAIRQVLSKEENIKRAKAVLLSEKAKGNEAALDGWNQIRAHAIGQLFDKAMVANSNLGEGQMGAVSGAKLNSALNAFGTPKLKLLLSESEYNQLMKLRRITANATIPIKDTTNPSGSGHLIARFLKGFGHHAWQLASHELPFVGYPMRAGAAMAEAAAQKAAEGATREGVTGFDASAAAAADAAKQP